MQWSLLLSPRWIRVINAQAYKTHKELGSETKQNKTSKTKNKILTMAKPIDVRDFLSTSHNNAKQTSWSAPKLLPL